jgi:uncharacterized protein (DUF1810 family)
MLQQNWCLIEPVGDQAVEMVFFDDHGSVFDWRPAAGIKEAEQALQTNGFFWMLESPSFYLASGVPKRPKAGERFRDRPVYSSGEYWIDEPYIESTRFNNQRIPTRRGERDLERFVDAQDPVWYSVVEELANGRKETHWMWFMFPQLCGLGSSKLANYFGLKDPREAAAYWDDHTLGFRLRSCVEILANLPGDRSAFEIFGKVDAMKLRSCMTLFESVATDEAAIKVLLNRYFNDQRCQPTLNTIKAAPSARKMFISK